MRSKLFDRRTAEWSGDKLAAYLKFRQALLTYGFNGAGGLGRAGTRGHSPMSLTANTIATDSELTDWLHRSPADLLSANPYEVSRREFPAGTKPIRCWDAALLLPDFAAGLPALVSEKAIAATRRVNTHWLETVPASLARTGKLGGSVLRPSGPYIYDLTRANAHAAWDLLETAGVLAYIRRSRPARGYLGELAPKFREAVAEVVTATLYGLPLRIGGKQDGSLPFGLKTVVSSGFEGAAMLVDVNDPEIDATTAYILSAAYTQPHPSSLHSGVVSAARSDMWCGLPSIVAVAGWESVEYISRQRLVEPLYARATYYGVSPADLMPPASLWAHISLALAATGDPYDDVDESMKRIEEAESLLATLQGGPDYEALRGLIWDRVMETGVTVNLVDWRKTDHYAWLLEHTPPFPFLPYMAANRNAKGAPDKPKGIIPNGSKSKMPPEWKRWFEDAARMAEISAKAAAAYERERYGYSASARRRRERMAGHKYAERRRADSLRREVISAKRMRGKTVTRADRDFLERMRLQAIEQDRLSAKLPEAFQQKGVCYHG